MNAQLIHRIDTYLTSSVRSIAESERLKPCSSLRRIALLGALCCFTAGSLIWVQPAEASTKEDMLRLYAHSKIVNYKQYRCLDSIITKESHWNPNAKNGSHYGLGQMKSQHYRTLDPYRQIDATISYITKRYGSMCNAWRFHQRKDFY